MEGIPRVPMFSLELLAPEKSLAPSFEEGIREYIVVNYQDDPSKFNHAFQKIHSMRNVIMQNVANVESICILKRYFAQISMIKARFPMEENDPLATPFTWIDRSYDLSASITYNDINFEMCCVLFNIGVSHALFAANETRSDADSIKNAFMHFQYASWPMIYLRDSMRCGTFAGMNFGEPFLTFYSDMFLAQAQECILEKSMMDGRKPLVIAKVALQLKKYYESNLSLLSLLAAELTSIGRYKALFRLCSAKFELYDALAHYYLALQAENEKEMGFKVSYLKYALERINLACKAVSKDDRDSLRQAVQYAYDVISQKEDNAQKENNFIYHAKMTKPEDFPLVEGVVMVKPIGFDINDTSVCGEDLFASLLPTDVLKTVSMYSEEKAKLRREIVEKVRQKDSELESYLISLQLNQLHLDEPIESVRLPDELLSSSAAFSSQPNAFPTLIDKFDDITKMAGDAEMKLARLSDKIKEVHTAELAKDEGFRAIKSKVDELNSHHIKARENNAELQRAIATHSENLKILAMPLTQLTKQICGDYINPMEHPEGAQLRKVLDKVDEMQRQRCKLLQTFEEDLNGDDITKKALANRDFHPQELFENELKKHTKTLNLINQNLIAQENILSALTETNANFSEFRRRIVEANEKRALHSLTLVTAYQVFMDVVGKTDNALSFYKQLFAMIDAFSKSVKIIEEIEEKKRKDAERLKAEKKMAKESAEVLNEFAFAPTSSKAPGSAISPLPQASTPSVLASNDYRSSTPGGGGGRPRLGDYLDFYRNKMASKNDAVKPTISTNSEIPSTYYGNTMLPNSSLTRLPNPSASLQTTAYGQAHFAATNHLVNFSSQPAAPLSQQYPMFTPINQPTTFLNQPPNLSGQPIVSNGPRSSSQFFLPDVQQQKMLQQVTMNNRATVISSYNMPANAGLPSSASTFASYGNNMKTPNSSISQPSYQPARINQTISFGHSNFTPLEQPQNIQSGLHYQPLDVVNQPSNAQSQPTIPNPALMSQQPMMSRPIQPSILPNQPANLNYSNQTSMFNSPHPSLQIPPGEPKQQMAQFPNFDMTSGLPTSVNLVKPIPVNLMAPLANMISKPAYNNTNVSTAFLITSNSGLYQQPPSSANLTMVLPPLNSEMPASSMAIPSASTMSSLPINGNTTSSPWHQNMANMNPYAANNTYNRLI